MGIAYWLLGILGIAHWLLGMLGITYWLMGILCIAYSFNHPVQGAGLAGKVNSNEIWVEKLAFCEDKYFRLVQSGGGGCK